MTIHHGMTRSILLAALLLLGCSAEASQVPTPREAHPAASLADGLHGAPDSASDDGHPERGKGTLGDADNATSGSQTDNGNAAANTVFVEPINPPLLRSSQNGQVHSGPSHPVATTGALLPSRTGTWAYAKPSHGSGYLAIPEGPGWIVQVCGPLTCFEAVSTDAGPELWLQKPPHSRIGDLSAVMFQRACGPLSAGLCSGSYEILGAADQHPDDPPEHEADRRMRLEDRELPATSTEETP